MELNIDEIKKIMPHRYPFLLVDKILSVTEGKTAVGIKNVTANEPFFEGHFPDYPVMPGVLIVEALAQTAGICLFASGNPENKLGMFAGIDRARFKREVRPGDVLQLDVEITRYRGTIAKAIGKATVAGELACEVDMMFAIVTK